LRELPSDICIKINSMCGRFTLTLDPGELREELDLGAIADELLKRFNIAPTQPVAVVTDAGSRQVELYNWGLIPSWAKDPSIGSRMINARAETLAEKPSFRKAFEQRRCLILADGFFEWSHTDGQSSRKTPYYFHLPEHKAFTLAGLWEFWRDPKGKEVRTCTIITCQANADVGRFHERMPVILPPESRWKWLEPGIRPAILNSYLVPYPEGEIQYYPVSPMVNNPAFDDPACVLPVK
jgi:putative SOS response-associated peptidase YedK